MIQECLEKVVKQQTKRGDEALVDEIDLLVEEIEKKKTYKTCGNCDTEVPKRKRICPNCGVNLKAFENEASGESIMGTALVKETQAQHRYREVEVFIESTGSETTMKKKTVFGDLKVEWSHVPSNHESAVKISVSDPIFANPSSYEAVAEVFRLIGKTAKITRYGFSGPEAREWISITMDGSPYILSTNLIANTRICSLCASSSDDSRVASYFGKEWTKHIESVHQNKASVPFVREFDWVMLTIGPLHVEMNMVKTFFSMNWNVMVEDLAKQMGFITDSALSYAKKASNHHQAMTMIEVLQKGGWSELLLPYVRSMMSQNKSCSVHDFIDWMATAEDDTVVYLFEQLWSYIGAIKVYHIGIRRNNSTYIDAGLKSFAPMFSCHPYSSKYQLIEIHDRYFYYNFKA